jgi:hypothetical protein
MLEALKQPPVKGDKVKWIWKIEQEIPHFMIGKVVAVYGNPAYPVTVDCTSIFGRTAHRWWDLYQVDKGE